MQCVPVVTGVLAALEEELGPLRAVEARASLGRRERVLGVEVARFEVALPGEGAGAPVLVVCSGVGKVAAAHGAAALLAAGAGRVLVVGTCGGLHPATGVGTLVHAEVAVQWDLAVREGREVRADEGLREVWWGVAGGVLGCMTTADRPAVRLLERWRRQRARSRAGGGRVAVADMETAAVGAVAARAGVPWAALRAVSDAARPGSAGDFVRNLPAQGPRAAGTVVGLLAALGRVGAGG